jgi:hypothetical protein
MSSSAKIWDGSDWIDLKGDPGPTVVSGDEGNTAVLGSDGFLHAPAIPHTGQRYGTIRDGETVVEAMIRVTAACDPYETSVLLVLLVPQGTYQLGEWDDSETVGNFRILGVGMPTLEGGVDTWRMGNFDFENVAFADGFRAAFRWANRYVSVRLRNVTIGGDDAIELPPRCYLEDVAVEKGRVTIDGPFSGNDALDKAELRRCRFGLDCYAEVLFGDFWQVTMAQDIYVSATGSSTFAECSFGELTVSYVGPQSIQTLHQLLINCFVEDKIIVAKGLAELIDCRFRSGIDVLAEGRILAHGCNFGNGISLNSASNSLTDCTTAAMNTAPPSNNFLRCSLGRVRDNGGSFVDCEFLWLLGLVVGNRLTGTYIRCHSGVAGSTGIGPEGSGRPFQNVDGLCVDCVSAGGFSFNGGNGRFLRCVAGKLWNGIPQPSFQDDANGLGKKVRYCVLDDLTPVTDR